jgi:hypothetical protein
VHVYEVRPRKDDRGVDLISDGPLFGRLWHAEPGRNQQRNRLPRCFIFAAFYEPGGKA